MSRLDIPAPEEGFGRRAGDRMVMCLDEGDGNDYKEFEDDNGIKSTMVPRSRVEGGILGLTDFDDRRYGKGVKRRNIEYDAGDNEYHVTSEKDNFRPDGKVISE